MFEREFDELPFEWCGSAVRWGKHPAAEPAAEEQA
jgi:hypothetical protein